MIFLFRLLVIIFTPSVVFARFEVINAKTYPNGMILTVIDTTGNTQLAPHEFFESDKGILVRARVKSILGVDQRATYILRTQSKVDISVGDILRLDTPKISESSTPVDADPFWLIPISVSWKAGALLDSNWAFASEIGLFESGNIRLDFLSYNDSGIQNGFKYSLQASQIDFGYMMFLNERFNGLFYGPFIIVGNASAVVRNSQGLFDRTSKVFFGVGGRVGYRWVGPHGFFFEMALAPSYSRSSIFINTTIIHNVTVNTRKRSLDLGYDNLVTMGFVF